ncbi:GTP cyclohydrolase FolE2 [Parapusillimonas granuli]|uniref:GTP cyclohydrolase FolE2 n=1 Tax=Parapusillimonas granuli TaxID=380911 RepID=A0A853G7B8_9BURK|nr:GTP cyclohydrolase FolE2 [Parapusillimonas granuli]MBB5216853.1 GTP cyclohydrolase I [Parapusillimonas granuli]MEB2401498.1 GTP cyclohydrolase FolE2 [Alcaligenaceae bacterium]NYT51652.1 GTP cyclohydrolase I FolE2 [Parapusillimonas granuli]
MNTLIDPVVAMPDVQSSLDTRHIAIQRVGVKGVRHPMLISMRDGTAMPTVANWELTVALPAHEKGTHMSRFVALLEEHRQTPMTPAGFCDMARKMLPLLNAERGDMTASFPYFLNKTAPVSGVASLMDYELTWAARVGKNPESIEFELSVLVPVTSLCPCSKAISEYGAHNQRSHVTATVAYGDPRLADPEALIHEVERQASCELWGLLKRVDEKFVTERAYENPKFVEDLVRDVADRLKRLSGLRRYRVVAENFESIHNHSAYAVVEG